MSKKVRKKELKEQALTQSYTIEALQDEITELEERNRINGEKLWEVIQENDRLTMTYEPYRPPGDEHKDLDFYGLIEENEELTAKVLEKMQIIRELDQEIVNLNYKLRQIEQSMVEMKPAAKKPRIKNERWWNVSLELWPGAWGLNYYRYKWRKYGSNSREGQMQVGPFGFSWNREPKR